MVMPCIGVFVASTALAFLPQPQLLYIQMYTELSSVIVSEKSDYVKQRA